VVDQDNADLAAAEDRREKDKTDLAHAKAAFERMRPARSAGISRKALDNSHRTYEQAQTQTSSTRRRLQSFKQRFMPPRLISATRYRFTD